MLSKMPQKTVKSSFRNKLTIISLILLMGLGLSAAYFTVPSLQSPIPTTNNLIGNTTNNTITAPVSHTNASTIGIETPQVNTTSTNTNKSTGNTPSASTSKQVKNTSNKGTNTNKQGSNTSKTTTNKIKTSTNSQTSPSSTKKTTNNTG